ncbi:hypothetical protein VHEMI02445 [[Torrubiella] hemipterigena]|uniref:FAD-binding PCMH-type domain-containing protein n=1 Tax=[Torrubiella] hemipterigena TaxID=1531966 RepID=A0A0A1T873_9HYPO|nr:hypothetical protein VHEMI02445 [[Torrubiella] hemipterigena]
MALNLHFAATLLLLLQPTGAHAQTAANITSGYPPCDALITGNLGHAVHLADSPQYPSLVNGSWAPSTRKSPFCFVQPSSTEEVSRTLSILNKAGGGAGDWHIALRSGGHGTHNCNNIDTGVTIDLTMLNTSTYDATTNIASIGTGARWGQVYGDLLQHGVSVVGGREGVVGVGGLILGGGVSWYTPKRGFACDSVVNYEVVLADGSIIQANRSSHSDLWRALKGGGANFGIVTRFDIEAFPAVNVIKATRTVSMDHVDEVIDAIVEFTDRDASFADNYLLTAFNYNPAANATTITITEVNTANNASTEAFDTVNRIPTVRESVEPKSMTLAASSHSSALTDDMLTVGAGPITVINEAKVLKYIVSQYDRFVQDIAKAVDASNFSTIFDLQPISTNAATYGAHKGGNMLGLDTCNRSRILAAFGAILFEGQHSKRDVARIYQLAAAANQRIKAYAASIGALDRFVYLPYADASQDPLSSYGVNNTEHIRKVAHKFDPHGFFQHRVPGGFKISRTVKGAWGSQ